jgi:hypothetical protein
MRRASAIRELAAARNAPRIAAAFVERTIQVWDLRNSELLSEFDTVYDFGGGHRSALNPTGELCVAAGWLKGMRGGVACYNGLTGVRLWHRTDIRQTLFVKFSCSGEFVWVGLYSGRFQKLDAGTGATVDQFVSVGEVFDSPYSKLLLLAMRKRGYLLRGAKDSRIPNLSFGLLDVAFSPDRVCLTEAGGPVRCLDCQSGVEIWRYEPPRDTHVLRLNYRPADRNFYGVQWEYGHGTSRTLFRFADGGGRYEELCQLHSWYEEFCEDGDVLVTSVGEVISVAGGRIINQLMFPQKDYPDKITV